MVSCRTSAVTMVAASPPHSSVSEVRWIEESCRGDVAAFDQLVAQHYDAVYAVARRLSPSPDDAEDVAQEVFLAAWRQLGRFQKRAAFKTWLIAICIRQCAAHTRKCGGRTSSLDDLGAREPCAPDAASPAATLERREQEGALHRAIHGLPRAQREAVVLHYFGGFTCAETASAMGISAGAVMTHLFRARKTLRDTLGWLVEETSR
jgi:RNA polymerase sigma-70 factor (ECF subfamily)